MRGPNSRENVCYFVETWRGRNAWDMARLVPSWTRLDKQQERDVRELIRRVSGLQDEADPNFQLALNFAWSNFRCAACEPCSWVLAARRRRGRLLGRGGACGWAAGPWEGGVGASL